MFLVIKTRNAGELLRANVPYIVSRMSIRVVYLNCSHPHLGGFFNVFSMCFSCSHLPALTVPLRRQAHERSKQ